MRTYLGPVQIIGLLLALSGIIVGQPAVIALGVIAWVGAVAVSTMKKSSRWHQGIEDKNTRTMLQPFLRLKRELEQLVRDNPDNPTVRVIGAAALGEADELVKKAATVDQLLRDSQDVPRLLARAQDELDLAKERKQNTTDEAQLATLNVAIESREAEVGQYSKIVETLSSAQQRIKDSELALNAIRARLSAAVLDGASDGLQEDDLSGMVNRLKSLSSSLEEVEEMKETLA